MKPSEVRQGCLVLILKASSLVFQSDLVGKVILIRVFHEATEKWGRPTYDPYDVRPLTPDEETVWRLTGKGPAL